MARAGRGLADERAMARPRLVGMGAWGVKLMGVPDLETGGVGRSVSRSTYVHAGM